MKDQFDGIPEAEIETQVKEFLDDMKTNGFIGKILIRYNHFVDLIYFKIINQQIKRFVTDKSVP